MKRACWIFALSSLLPGLRAQQPAVIRLDTLYRLAQPADALEVDEEANLYLVRTNQSQLQKCFHLYGYDSVLTIGGAGLRTEGLYRPVKARVAARNKLYLLDYANRRISLFSVNLRPVRAWDFADPAAIATNADYQIPIFPRSFTVSPQGDLYVLNAEDNRTLKYDHLGELQLIFGGMDFGEGTLSNPAELEFDPDDYLNPYVYVADRTAQQIKVFDIFGVYAFSLPQQPLPFRWDGFRVYGRRLVCWDATRIWVQPLDAGKPARYLRPELVQPILDVVPHRKGLFILTKNAVLLYPNS
ncbi:MAG: hypothetical protein KF690_06030 [Bacteroidetes bacterium]|nr:hypothetical protein [Bacteroidota bacterium]